MSAEQKAKSEGRSNYCSLIASSIKDFFEKTSPLDAYWVDLVFVKDQPVLST